MPNGGISRYPLDVYRPPVLGQHVHPLHLADPVAEVLRGAAGHRHGVHQADQELDVLVQWERDVPVPLDAGQLALLVDGEPAHDGIVRRPRLDHHG
jgi:hypothetical protein